MRTFRLAILIGAVFLAGGAYAQQTLSLSLEEAQSYAIEYNKQVENAALSVEQAQKKINESISSFLPQAEVAMDYSNFMGAEMEFRFNEALPPQTIPFKPTSNLYFNLSQMIFSGNFIVGLQMVKIYKEMEGKNYLKTSQDIRELVTRSYHGALVSDLTIDIIRENIENTRKIFNNTEAMVSVGMAEKLDLDQLEVQQSSLENALKSAERQRELSYNLLRFQLGVKAGTPLELTDSLEYFLENFDFAGILEQEFYIDRNLDYQLMLIQEQLSEKQVGLQKMNFLPTLNGFYSHTNKILKSDFDLSPKNVIGLNLSIPILSSGMRIAQMNQARIELEKTQNNKILLEEQLSITEKQLRYNLANAIDQYLNRKKNADVALRIYQDYQFRYEQGIASSLDLNLSNNNYLQAVSDYVQSIITLLNARLDLQKLMNTL